MFNLSGTPYILEGESEQQLRKLLDAIEERVSLLRSSGVLTEATIRKYYGEKRFEQVAESNAIEGNTLTAGETELAVLKGVTITGHDPGYVRDAVALDKALARLAEMAKEKNSTVDIQQLHEIHGILMGDRPGGGVFRSVRVAIRGSKHTPPKEWKEIMDQMDVWQKWSKDNAELPAPIRAVVLHYWLVHIHPYVDGNGRVARAISNLELIRSGYPPVIMKRKERDRYCEALAESDEGGDIRSFFELMFEKISGALGGLENSAKQMESYNPVVERLRASQRNQLKVWDASVKLLATMIEHKLSGRLEQVGGACSVRIFDEPLDFDDYLEVSSGRSVPQSWAFIVRVSVPGLPAIEQLVYVGHRGLIMYNELNKEGGPSLYWSGRNPAGIPKWTSTGEMDIVGVEMTTRIGNGDDWFVRRPPASVVRTNTTDLAEQIASHLLLLVVPKA